MAIAASKVKAAKEFYAVVKKICAKNNLLAYKAIVAQAVCETGWFTCALTPYHNYFGMKCGGSWKGTSVNLNTKEEYTAGTLTNITANFRTYATMEDGVQGYCDFICNYKSRYGNLIGVTDNNTYIENIKADGWATSSTYVKTLKSIMATCEAAGVYDEDSASTTTVTPVTQVSNVNTAYNMLESYTTSVSLNIRKQAGTGYAKLTCVPKGTKLLLIDRCNASDGSTWVRVVKDNIAGWACAITSKGEKYII